MLGNNAFSHAETIQAPLPAVFSHLVDVQNSPATYAITTKSVELLTAGPLGVGTAWKETRRALFLREVLEFTVTAFEAPKDGHAHFAVVMEDGRNIVMYDYQLRSNGAASTTVTCTVNCHMRLGTDNPGPSERLAKMVEKQDGALVKRLKGYLEASHTACPMQAVC